MGVLKLISCSQLAVGTAKEARKTAHGFIFPDSPSNMHMQAGVPLENLLMRNNQG